MKRNNGKANEILRDEISREQEEHIAQLTESVSAIKQITGAIKNKMVDDESLVTDIDRGFDKNKSLMSSTVSKIDKVITSASSNILCYVLLFAVIVLTLLYKMTK